MNAPKRFCFAEWRRSISAPQFSLIEIDDELKIGFDEYQSSTLCEILVKNHGQQCVTIAAITYEDNLLQLAQEPECKTIQPFGVISYSFKAIHFTRTRMASAVVRFLFADEKVVTRTIIIDYNNNALIAGSIILNRKKNFYDIPAVFIEATDSRLAQSKISDSVDALVPTFDEMMYENYQAHFHGLLYLEELYINREYAQLVRRNVAFRRNGNHFELDYEHSTHRLNIAIGK